MINKNILVLPYSHQLGSSLPLMQAGLYLKHAGYNVIFGGEGYCLDFLKADKIKTIKMSEIPYDIYREQTDKANLDYLTYDQVENFVKEELEVIKKYKIDMIIDTLRPTTFISTKIAKIPRITLEYAVLTRYYPLPICIPESHVLDATKPFPILYDSLCKIAKSVIRENVYRKCASVYREYMEKNNIDYDHSTTYEDLISKSDRTFIYDIREFYPLEKEPETFVYTGAMLYKLKTKKISWLAEVKERKIKEKAFVIYLSMGSSGYIFPQIIAFLNEYTKKNKHVIVVTNSTNHDINSTIDSPNVYVTGYAAADDLLAISDILISHGGKGTIYHALKFGLPFIGIPHQAEQEWNLQRAEDLKVGIMCSKKRFSIELLAEKLKYLLENLAEYQMNARRFIGYAHSYNSERIVIEAVNNVFKEKEKI